MNQQTRQYARQTPASGTSSGSAVLDPSADRLGKELRGVLPILPVLTTQLREVTRQIEDSVVTVCANFQNMAQRARHAVAHAPLVGATSAGAGDTGVENLIQGTRKIMGELLTRIDQTSSFSAGTVEQMRNMTQQVAELNATLTHIDDVASSARVLAFNGQIEAARSGAQGAAFGVVATETATMANHALRSSKEIKRIVEKISRDITAASLALEERAAADSRAAAASRKEVNQAFDAMGALHEDMQKALAESHHSGEQLAKEISGAIVAMQFQDSVSQRIGHVIHSLEEIQSTLEARLRQGDSEEERSESGDWAQRMAEKYTMASEHKVLAVHAGRSRTDEDLGGNVELF